jgi:hypothetical protein
MAPLQAEPDQFIVFLVDAPHLDYSSTQTFFRTLCKHPDTGAKQGQIGHAWVYLQGYRDGVLCQMEGGHSGEVDPEQERYFDALVNAALSGQPNPLALLHQAREDGFFQRGNGAHWPTTAVRLAVDDRQFKRLCQVLEEDYDFQRYHLLKWQCCQLIVTLARELEIDLSGQVEMTIQDHVHLGHRRVRLWDDPCWQTLRFDTPDRLEEALQALIVTGEGENALGWYAHSHQKTDTVKPGLWYWMRRSLWWLAFWGVG